MITRRVVHALDPVDALTTVSEGAGLLVVGSRGHGGFLGLRLGSTVDGLIRHAGATGCCRSRRTHIVIVTTRPIAATAPPLGGVVAAAAASVGDVFAATDSSPAGLTSAQATQRLQTFGPNAVATRRARLWPVLVAQVRSPLLVLLIVAVAVSFVVAERTDAVIIGVIVALSVGLGVINEYRAARAADLLHDQVQRKATVVRDGNPIRIDVADLVPGDVVHLRLGDIIPADLRLVDGTGLACEESVLTGESMPVDKAPTRSSMARVPP